MRGQGKDCVSLSSQYVRSKMVDGSHRYCDKSVLVIVIVQLPRTLRLRRSDIRGCNLGLGDEVRGDLVALKIQVIPWLSHT